MRRGTVKDWATADRKTLMESEKAGEDRRLKLSEDDGVQEVSQQKAPSALIRVQITRFLFRLSFMKMLSLTEDACPETGGFTFQNPKYPFDFISNKALKSPQKLRKRGKTHTNKRKSNNN